MKAKAKHAPQETLDGPFAGLPELLRIAAKAGGIDAIIAIIKARGGRWTSVPKRLSADHWLLKATSRDVADAIAREFGGQSMMIPNGRGLVPRAIAAKVLMSGGSFNDAVVASGLHYRTIQRIKDKLDAGLVTEALFVEQISKGPKGDARQLSLFDPR